MHLVRWTPRGRTALALALALGLTRCGGDDPSRRFAPPAASDAAVDVGVHASTVFMPAALSGIRGTTTDSNGHPVDVSCATCHRGRTFELPTSPAGLRGPHVGMTFAHGGNRCASCHDPRDAERLRLADGRTVPVAEAMALCAQCHGTQARDYRHGAHGGMTGYWDLRRGPRVRNHCVSCHDPHAPAFASYLPLPPPHDAPRLPTHGTHR